MLQVWRSVWVRVTSMLLITLSAVDAPHRLLIVAVAPFTVDWGRAYRARTTLASDAVWGR